MKKPKRTVPIIVLFKVTRNREKELAHLARAWGFQSIDQYIKFHVEKIGLHGEFLNTYLK